MKFVARTGNPVSMGFELGLNNAENFDTTDNMKFNNNSATFNNPITLNSVTTDECLIDLSILSQYDDWMMLNNQVIDKIEYIGHRGHYLRLFNGDYEYKSQLTPINNLNATCVFSDETSSYNSTLVASDALDGYDVKYLLATDEITDWVSKNYLATTGIVTITFKQPIHITHLSIKPNRDGAVYTYNDATINVYYKNILINKSEWHSIGNTKDIFSVGDIHYSYFIKSENNYYTIANGQLTQVVDTSAGGFIDLSLITPTLLQGLSQPNLVVKSDSESEIPNNIILQAQVKFPGQTIIQNNDIHIQEAEELSNIRVTYTGTGIFKICLSIDSGMNWIKYDGSNWVEIAGFEDGMSVDTIQNLTTEQLDYIVQANKVRFGFYMEQETYDDNLQLSSISFLMKKEGLWSSCIVNTDYKYGRGTDFIEFTALKAGDYLINYTG